MPSLGADMDAGTLVEWRVKPGDRVKRGDIVAVVETRARPTIEVEVFEDGEVEELLVPDRRASAGRRADRDHQGGRTIRRGASRPGARRG